MIIFSLFFDEQVWLAGLKNHGSQKSKNISTPSVFFSHELGTTIAGSIDSSLKGLFGIFVLGFFFAKGKPCLLCKFCFLFLEEGCGS